MIVREERHTPLTWPQRRQQVPGWSVPFFFLEWIWEWLAFLLSRWNFVVVLDYLGSLSILVAVFFYFHDSGNRLKQRHYEAWQVINTAQGKGGSGGRIEALQELNEDRVPLVGVDVSGAFLQGVRLGGGRLLRSDFSAADVRNSDFTSADFTDADLHSGNFRQSDFRHTSLVGARLDDGDFEGSDFSYSDLSGANLDNADLRFSSLDNARWSQIRSIKGANLYGLRDAPAGFIVWAAKSGAVQIKDDDWQSSRSGR